MSASFISWEEAVCRLRADPGQQELVRDCYYDDPIDEAAARYAGSEEWQEVCRLLAGKIPGAVLDIGAGRGISSYAFARHGCTVTALEPDPSPLVGAGAIRELVARTGLPVVIVEESGERLPFADESFDIVYGRAVCHHAERLEDFCAEAGRVLKKGGTLLMTREHAISRKSDLQAFLDAHPLHALYGGENAYRVEEYAAAIRNAGLRELQVIGPFENVINYAPMTTAEIRRLIGQSWPFPIGKGTVERLAGWSAFRAWQGRRLSRQCDDPGRLYTFRASK